MIKSLKKYVENNNGNWQDFVSENSEIILKILAGADPTNLLAELDISNNDFVISDLIQNVDNAVVDAPAIKTVGFSSRVRLNRSSLVGPHVNTGMNYFNWTSIYSSSITSISSTKLVPGFNFHSDALVKSISLPYYAYYRSKWSFKFVLFVQHIDNTKTLKFTSPELKIGTYRKPEYYKTFFKTPIEVKNGESLVILFFHPSGVGREYLTINSAVLEYVSV